MALAAFKLPKKIPGLIEKVKEIIGKVASNASIYASPVPAAATLTALADNLDASYQRALRGGTDKKLKMHLDKKRLLDSMASLLGYIQSASDGDAEKINLVSDVKKKGAPKGLLPPPGNVRSDYGIHDGEIIFLWNGVPGRAIYFMQLNDSHGDDTKWVNAGFTGKKRFEATGLISGNQYAFRIATISTAGVSAWSDVSVHKAR